MLRSILRHSRFSSVLLVFVLMHVLSGAVAQVLGTVKGVVTDSLGQPLPSVTIVVKGTQKATMSQANGSYTLNEMKAEDILVFTHTGFESQEIIVGSNPILNVRMLLANGTLDQVVVTAAGIKRSKKALGYSVQEVNSEDIIKSNEANMVTALSGKVAGVQVTSSSGAVGGVAQIRIRGSASLTGNNSPLFVIDGIPIDNSQVRTQAQGDANGGVSQSSRAIDINPNDIESMTVLKGPAATALYGIRAASGAVIITTKSGQKRAGGGKMFFSSTYTISEQNGYQEMQNKFSQGTEVGRLNPQYRDPSQATNTSFGPLISNLTYSNIPSAFTRQGRIVPKTDPASNGIPVETYDNAGNFFVKGAQFENYLSFSNASEKGSFFMSAGTLNQTGIIPTEEFSRKTFKVTGKSYLTSKLTATASASYTNSSGNRVQQGSNPSGIMQSLLRGAVTFDITNGYKDPLSEPLAYQLIDGGQRNEGGNTSGRDNPYWSVNMNKYNDKVDRLIGFAELDYQVLPWLKALGRIGIDYYNEERKEVFSRYSRAVPLGTIAEADNLQRNINSDLMLTAQTTIAKDMDLTFLVGHNYYGAYSHYQNLTGSQLTIPDFQNASGAAVINGGAGYYQKKLNALYGDLRLAYGNWAFLNVTARNEWSSTLPQDNNSFFYPSVSLGVDITEAFKIRNQILSYAKLRASYGQVGNDAPVYALYNTYVNAGTNSTLYTNGISFPFNGLLGLSLNNNAGNLLLKPEVRVSTEYGGEFRLFKNRLNVDVTFYTSQSKDLIVNVPLPSGSGFTNSIQNAGELTNKGWEIVLDGNIIQSGKFKWYAMLNWSKNVSEITKIANGITSIGVTSVGPLGQVRLVLGEQYGSFYGNDFVRDGNVNVIIDDQATLSNGSPNTNYGFPFRDPNPKVIGNPNPKWLAGFRNNFTYKNFTLSALIDVRYKFDVFNSTLGAMNQTGTSKESEDRYTPYVFTGVQKTSGKPSNIEVQKGQYWYTGAGGGFGSGVQSQFVEDGTWFRLRDLSISLSLPTVAKKVKMQNIEAGLTARNLLLITSYSGVDPEVNLNGDNNASGYDYFTTPNTKSYGGFLRLWFQ
jgi:TonB-linked SusC/RagA family outer membrane protein